jgi:hypothetical protein
LNPNSFKSDWPLKILLHVIGISQIPILKNLSFSELRISQKQFIFCLKYVKISLEWSKK